MRISSSRSIQPKGARLAWALLLFLVAAAGRAETPRFVVDDQEFLDQVCAAAAKLEQAGKLLPVETLQRQLNRRYAAVPPTAPEGDTLSPPELYDRLLESTLAIGDFYRCDACTNWHFNAATAFVVGSNGVISTSYHVVGDGQDEPLGSPDYLVAADRHGRVYPVRAVLAADPDADTCLLQIDAGGLRPLAVRPNVRTGERVYCLSHPEGSHFMFTEGIVARVMRSREVNSAEEPDGTPRPEGRPTLYVNVTAEFSPGSSGGPIVDGLGNVVAQVQSVAAGLESDGRTDSTNAFVSGPVRYCVAAEEILRLTRPPDGYAAPAPLAQPPGFQPDTDLDAQALVAAIRDLFGRGQEALVEQDAPRIGGKFFRKFDAFAQDYTQRFPGETNRWEVALLQARADHLRHERLVFKGPEAVPTRLQQLLAASDPTADQKLEASHLLVAIAAGKAGHGLKLGAWEKLLNHHLADFPQDPDAAALSLQHLRLVEALAPARLATVATRLSQSSDAEVANAAADKLTALRVRRELQTQPLELKFKALDGREVDLAQMRGKVVLVDFRALESEADAPRLADLIAAYRKFHAHGLEIVGISVDSDRGELLRALRQSKVAWPLAFDAQGWEGALVKRFGIEQVPTLWLVDKQGRVVDFDVTEDLEGKLARLLGH
jgi:peroxiredoxin